MLVRENQESRREKKAEWVTQIKFYFNKAAWGAGTESQPSVPDGRWEESEWQQGKQMQELGDGILPVWHPGAQPRKRANQWSPVFQVWEQAVLNLDAFHKIRNGIALEDLV